MANMQLLDCTVRDGGYVNDWEFGRNRLISIFERLVDTGVDIIEIGFLDERRPLDMNRSIMPDSKAVNAIWGKVKKKPSMVVGMIDYGTCAIENLETCKESFMDGIRVIFKKQKMYEAMEFCAQVKKLGYKVFSQLVSITAYNDEDLKELISLINDIEPYAVSMVDTYGLLMPQQLLHYAEVLDANIKKNIWLGFHAHNNLQMAYANAQAFLARKTERDILVDGTLFGMGKSAGNAPLELLAKTMNQLYGKKYNILPMLEAIEDSIRPIYEITPWGYKTFFYMTADKECHPNYLEYFQKKENLSQSMLFELLEQIYPEEKKLLYDEELAEKLYQKFIREKFDDRRVYLDIRKEFKDCPVLLAGPGKNICLQKEKVEEYIYEKHPRVISVNYIPKDLDIDYIFVTKSNRYEDMTIDLHENKKIKFIATSNIECKNGKFEYVVMREPLLEKKARIIDNSFLMLLKVLKASGIKDIACAGFDGYSSREQNYSVPAMEYNFVKDVAELLNRHIRYTLLHDFKDMNIKFVTYSHYTDFEDIENAAY